MMEIGSQKDYCSILAHAFLENHISVVKLDLKTGDATVLKSDMDLDITGRTLPWQKLITRYMERRAYPADRELISSITLERLREHCLDGKENFPMEVRCISEEDGIQWVEITVTKVSSDTHTALIATRNISEAKLIRSIVDLFVYQNYDYLLLIDGKKDSYIRFTGNKGHTPIPPENGAHYTADMIRYNQKYVVPEDCERVTASMQLPHIIQMLERSDTYSFTSGGVTKDGKYRRSRVTFIYYDKAAGLVLAARTDVTQIYLEEQEKSRQLAEALQNAQHDPMTGIYNQKATAELVKRSLESQYRNAAAFLFVDVDNFKMVNDTLGHQKGDELLCFLARRLQEIAGRSGIAGRIGGDEYLIYLPDISSIGNVEQTAQQICSIFDTYKTNALQKGFVSCSVGISIYPRDGTDYGTLVRKADQALYTSKRYGKSRHHLYSCEESGIGKP